MTNDEIRALATEALKHDAHVSPWSECSEMLTRIRDNNDAPVGDFDTQAERDAAVIFRNTAPALAKYVLGVLDAAPPLILASAFGSEEFAAGTHRVEWCYFGTWWQMRVDVEGIVTQYGLVGSGWRRRSGIGTFVDEYRVPARLVPIADADLDPATRGAL